MTGDGVSPEDFRVALSVYATGVTVVTAVGEQGASGATMSSGWLFEISWSGEQASILAK